MYTSAEDEHLMGCVKIPFSSFELAGKRHQNGKDATMWPKGRLPESGVA